MTIDIHIPCFNSSEKIMNLVDSIINQTHQDFNVTFFNNASNDETLEILNYICMADKRFKVLSRPKNIGPFLNIYNAITCKQEGYFALIADDMVIDRDYLSESLYQLQKDPTIALCYSGVLLRGDETITHFDSYSLMSENYRDRCISLANHLTLGTALYGVYNASLLQDMRRFWSNFYSIRLSDLQLLIQISMRGKIKQIEKVLISRKISKISIDYYSRIIQCYVTQNELPTFPFLAAIFYLSEDILEYKGDRELSFDVSYALLNRFKSIISHELLTNLDAVVAKKDYQVTLDCLKFLKFAKNIIDERALIDINAQNIVNNQLRVSLRSLKKQIEDQ